MIVENDANGDPHYKCAFNSQVCPLLKFTYANIHLVFSQVCEQLNAWIGGFQPILNRMTPNNFNCLLHSLLFLYTQRVIKAQQDKVKKSEDDDDDDETDTDGVNIDQDE